MTVRRPLRRRLMGTYTQQMLAPDRAKGVGSGVAQMLLGFGIVLGVGFLLLMLPIASTEREWQHPREALFTAVSAICVTGLVAVETGSHWSAFGEVVILALIQVGGLGYMVGTTVVLWTMGRRLGLRDRQMLRLYYGAPNMTETLSFARSVALFTLVFELAGALLLWFAFMGAGVPAPRALWWGVFHSISAFNNAGFSVTHADLLPFAGNPWVLGIIGILVIVGGLGYLPLITLARRRSLTKLPLDHKLIFATSGALLVAGAVFLTLVEWDNPATLGGVNAADRPLSGFFHSASARTAGFAATDLSALRDESQVVIMGLMFVGAAAGSTGGGLKVGAFSLLLAAMIATVRGSDEVAVFRRTIPTMVVRQAMTLALYFVALVFGFTLALSLVTDGPFVDIVFEAISALGTVGYSSVGTATLGPAAQSVLIVAMLAGRFSPLMLVLHMTKTRYRVRYRYPDDSVRLG